MTTDYKVFIDSNILVYLIDKDNSKKEKVIELTSEECLISTQVVCENVNVCIKKLKLPYKESMEHGNYLLSNFRISIIQPSTIEKCFLILDKYKYSLWDSMIVSSALENDCDILYSEYMQHKQLIDGRLKIVNPFKE
ncbi:MAG: PIN domain-containing protein [Ignavibacteria bacterium]|nr:PIN domain-containing protein [Ignavibacteria bacterium]